MNKEFMDKVYNRQKIENNKICAPYYINIPDTNGFSNGRDNKIGIKEDKLDIDYTKEFLNDNYRRKKESMIKQNFMDKEPITNIRLDSDTNKMIIPNYGNVDPGFAAVNPNDPTIEENFEDKIRGAIKEIRTIKSLKSSSLISLKRVIETIDKKDKQYKRDPIDVLSVDDLTTQIKIKAIRACLTSDNVKKEDELLDIAVYSILTLEKMIKEKKG